jgi:HEAT repeat-containing protein 5
VNASPEITTAACQICADFLSSGIVENLSIQSRPIKFLISLLNQFKGTPYLKEGEERTNGRTPSSNTVLKLAVSSALARLYVSKIPTDLRDSLYSDILADLFPLWVECIVDFAKLRYNVMGQSASAHYGLAARGVTLPVSSY